MSIREIRGPQSAFGSAFRSHPTHPTWGADLSGSLQGGGGVGGLLMCVANPKHRVLWVPDGMLPSMAYYFLYDGNGNVSETIHERGAVLGQYRYDGFGKLMGQNATHYVTTDANGIDQIYSGINQPFKFSTKWHDDTNHNSASYGPYCRSRSLVYYGYRTYSPDMGRWLGRDPIGERGGVENLYQAAPEHQPSTNSLRIFGVTGGNVYLEVMDGAGGFWSPGFTPPRKDICHELRQSHKELCDAVTLLDKMLAKVLFEKGLLSDKYYIKKEISKEEYQRNLQAILKRQASLASKSGEVTDHVIHIEEIMYELGCKFTECAQIKSDAPDFLPAEHKERMNKLEKYK